MENQKEVKNAELGEAEASRSTAVRRSGQLEQLIRVRFFQATKGDKGICGSDFDNMQEYVNINKNFILSISELRMFRLPLSGEPKQKYSILTMENDTNYYLKEDAYNILIDELKSAGHLA